MQGTPAPLPITEIMPPSSHPNNKNVILQDFNEKCKIRV